MTPIYRRGGTRVFDITFAGVALIVLSPVLLVAALTSASCLPRIVDLIEQQAR